MAPQQKKVEDITINERAPNQNIVLEYYINYWK